MITFRAYETQRDGKTSVEYYRGTKLWYRIVQYDDGWFHALTSKDAGHLVPTLELAKQRIAEHVQMIDRMAGTSSRIIFKNK